MNQELLLGFGFDFAAILDCNRSLCLAALRSKAFDLLYNIHSFGYSSEYDVSAIEPIGHNGCNEELRTVRVWPSVRHAQ